MWSIVHTIKHLFSVHSEGRGDEDGEAAQSQVQRANQDVAYMSAAQIDNLLQVGYSLLHY